MIKSPPTAQWHNYGLLLHSRGLSGASTSYDYECLPVRHTTTDASRSRMSTVTVPWMPKATTLLRLSGLRAVGGRATIEPPLHARLSGPRAFGGLPEPLLHAPPSGLRASGTKVGPTVAYCPVRIDPPCTVEGIGGDSDSSFWPCQESSLGLRITDTFGD